MDTSTTVWLRPSGMRTRSPPVMILTMRLRASAFAFASTSSPRRRRRRRRFPSRPLRLDDGVMGSVMRSAKRAVPGVSVAERRAVHRLAPSVRRPISFKMAFKSSSNPKSNNRSAS